MPLFGYSLPSLSGVCGVPPRLLSLLLLYPVTCLQATEAGEEQEDEKLGFPRLSCTLTPHGSTGKDTLEKKILKDSYFGTELP